MDESSGSHVQDVGEDRPIPAGINPSRPSIARVYDYVLGGKHHYESDRRAAAGFIAALPDAPLIARDNRLLLRRAVRYLVGEAGIGQIIDIGSGLPTVGNVHEIAHEVEPGVRVVYVDIDPIVLAHARALLADDRNTTVIVADLRQPELIFDDPTTRQFLDLDQPFAVLVSGILHHLSDSENPDRVTAEIRNRLHSGSYLMVSNFLGGDDPGAPELERGFLQGGLGTGRFRSRKDQLRYFDGLELVDPGFVYANDWRPDGETPADSPVHRLYAGGVARKP